MFFESLDAFSFWAGAAREEQHADEGFHISYLL